MLRKILMNMRFIGYCLKIECKGREWVLPWSDAYVAHEWGWVVQWSRLSPVAAGGFITGFSSFTGVGGASFRGGILSFIASSPLASANDVILWFGEKPWRAEI